MQRIGILGAGAWGTALALSARRAGRDVTLWAYEAEIAHAINSDHENRVFLPGISLDPGIAASPRLSDALDGAEAVLLAVPAQYARAVLRNAALDWLPGVACVICAKGIERGSGALMSEVVVESLPTASMAVLSGPSFAIEVARGLPTAITLASGDATTRAMLAAALATPTFRIYSSDDVVGAELGGAVKNVLAIACGVVEGRGLGENARAALITRGLTEMARLVVAAGGRPETPMGLSGLGDLVLTCTAMQSRNFSLGVALGRGEHLAEVLAGRIGVTEGVASADAVVAHAKCCGVDMPICQAVAAVLAGTADLDASIASLLARPIRAEAS